MAAAVTNVLTAGNDTDAQSFGAAQSAGCNMTVASGATDLYVLIGWQHNGSTTMPTTRAVTFNSVAMTEVIYSDGLPGNAAVGVYHLHSPPAGTFAIAASWVNFLSGYVTAIAASGSNGRNAANDVTSSSKTINVTGTSDGITVSVILGTNGNVPTVSGGTLFADDANENPGFGAAYNVGTSGTNSFAYTITATNQTTAAFNIIAAAAAGGFLNRQYWWNEC